MTGSTSFGRQLLVAVDVKGYGRNDDRRQERIQRYLEVVLDGAARRAGLHRACWERQVAGDGELALIPATEPEPTVVDDYTRHLAHEIDQLNADMAADRRLQLRMAIHHGVVTPAPMGYAGQGVVAVARMLDSTPLRDTLDDADLAVMLSGTVYQDVVVNGHTSLRTEQFAVVEVQVKELHTQAFIFLPGVLNPSWPGGTPSRAEPLVSEAATPAAPVEPAAPARPGPGPAQSPLVTNTFHGQVIIDRAVFGPDRESSQHG